MKLSGSTRVGDLVTEHEFLIEFLAGYSDKFEMLRNPLMRKTVGRFATLSKAAQIGGVDLEELLQAIAEKIRAETGEEVEVDLSRPETLKNIIKGLHEGKSVEEVKGEFAQLLRDVSPGEIAAMEQELVHEGVPEEEVKRLCDVHVAVFKDALDKHEAVEVPPGHPVHTFQKENAALGEIIERLRDLLPKEDEQVEKGQVAPKCPAIREEFERLATVETHYVRKENQLFPYMEKHGITAPPKVMWAVHDDIRALIKSVRAALEDCDVPVIVEQAPKLLSTVEDMIYKEENILFPMCLQVLTDEDWAGVREGEEDLGYALVTPDTGWEPGMPGAGVKNQAAALGALPLDTGLLTLEQVNLMLTNLPVDLSFVDENDEVRYYSESSERIFPRSPGVIGRKVQNCHPSKSVHMVEQILEAFRAGTRDVAEFWITFNERFIHIRYFAMRDPRGEYKGCLEVSQDVTDIRALEGEQRLLDWE